MRIFASIHCSFIDVWPHLLHNVCTQYTQMVTDSYVSLLFEDDSSEYLAHKAGEIALFTTHQCALWKGSKTGCFLSEDAAHFSLHKSHVSVQLRSRSLCSCILPKYN